LIYFLFRASFRQKKYLLQNV